jgi:hypothetical protein
VLPVLLPVLPLELPEPMLPLAPLLGEVVTLPLAPLELEDLLKCASHSEREIWPSLFVSTDEKLGVAVLALAALPPEALDDALGRLDESLEELPEAAGEDDELCAAAMPDRANSAAAVATLTNFTLNIRLNLLGRGFGEELRPASCKTCAPGQPAGAAFAVAERCHNACLQR